MRLLIFFACMCGIASPAFAQDADDAFVPYIDPDGVIEPGEFRDRSSFEAFHGLRLNADGTYEWALAVGAMDRRSAGIWQMQEGYAVLTTTPTPVAPEFIRNDDDPSEDAPFLMVRWENGRPAQGIDFTLICDDGKIIRHYTQADGWDLVPGECDDPVSISLEESTQNIGPSYFDLSERSGSLRFTLVPNDFGVMDLTGTHILPTEQGVSLSLDGHIVEMDRVTAD